MVKETKEQKNNVLLGLDFHSTFHDVYYTPHKTIKRKIPNFTKTWLEQIRVSLNMEDINESPGKDVRPTSSAWFNRQFWATGITYEIGDKTPREFIKKRGGFCPCPIGLLPKIRITRTFIRIFVII